MDIVKHTDLEAGMRDGTVLRSAARFEGSLMHPATARPALPEERLLEG